MRLGLFHGLLFCLLITLTGCAREAAVEEGPERDPNVIILFADDLGYGDLQCYGNPNIRTPELDRMAAEGLRLTSYYSGSSVCTPSRASLMTGRYALRAGLPGNLGPGSEGGLPLSEITMADLVKDLDYATMAIGKWHLGHSEPQWMPTSRGFDHYFGLLYSNDMRRPWVQTDVPLRLYRDLEALPEEVDQDQLTVRYTEEALSFIRENESSPFFLYLAYSMPHLPVHTAPRFQGQSIAGLYGDVIQTIDWSVGSILSLLRQLEIDDSTLVVFTSDNGPWLNLPDRMLQEGNERWHAGSPGPLNGAKGTSLEGGFRVPGIVWWPEDIPEGRVSSEMATSIDLFPTVAAVVGAELPQDRVYDGFNMLPFFRGEANSPRDHFYYLRGRRLEAVRVGDLKYRYSTFDVNLSGSQERSLAPQLFNLAVDFGERYNLIDRRPDDAETLRERFESFAEELGAEIEGEQQPGQ